MSGLAGVIWSDGRPAAAADAMALVARMAHRAGRVRCAARGPVVTATLDDEGACSPVEAEAGHLIVMLDGRIDNGDELLRALGLPASTSDVALLAHAWRRWGRECVQRLIGDFAFTVHDADVVFAARDCAPFRAFYYRATPRGCSWASELAPLVAVDPPPVNEGVVAEYLADRLTSIQETLFDGVHRLPPGHALELRVGRAPRVWPYWQPDPRAAIRYRDQRDYDEHFRVLFREAVRCRLPRAGRTAVWYSGGIDSSAVAAQVAWLRDDAEATVTSEVETLSIAAQGYGVDETPFFTGGARHLRLRNHVRPFHFGSAEDFADHSRLSLDIPPAPSMMGGRLGWQTLAAERVRVCLTGLGGDDWFIGSQFALIDDLRSLRWRSAAARWQAERRLPFGFTAGQLLKLGLWLHVPPRMRSIARQALGWTATPPHVSRGLAARAHLDDRLRAVKAPPPFRELATRQLFDAASAANVVITGEMYARMAARWRVEARHPFHDRRLVEFALALPADQLLRPGVPRYIVLRALLSQLPPNVYNRVDGVDYSVVMRDVLMRLGCERIVDAAIADLPDWIDGPALHEMARSIRQSTGIGVSRHMWALWQVFAVHTWWRAVQNPVAADTLEPRKVAYGQPAVPYP